MQVNSLALPDPHPYAELWIHYADDSVTACSTMSRLLNELMAALNTWVTAKPRHPQDMALAIRKCNGVWLRYCRATEGYGPALPSRPGCVASPAEWTWLAIMAQQGPYTRGLLKMLAIKPEVLRFLANPGSGPMPKIYGSIEDHRLVEIERDMTEPEPRQRHIRIKPKRAHAVARTVDVRVHNYPKINKFRLTMAQALAKI